MSTPRPPVRRGEFVNWGRNVRFRPGAVLGPRSEAELSAVVAAARERGARVRAVGGGHSWSPLCQTDGWLVSLDRMRRPLAVDAAAGRVTVEGGMRIHELYRFLVGRGLALENLPSITEQSIAGAIATATHGTGARFGCLSDQVEALRLVTASGAVLEVDARSPDLFAAARASLGALGIVSAVTLRVLPRYEVEEDSRPYPFDEALGALDGWVRSHDHVKLWWLPHTGRVMVFRYDRGGPARRARPSLLRAVEHSSLVRLGLTAIGAYGARRPERIPALNARVFSIYFRETKRRGPVDALLPIPMPPVHQEGEMGVEASRAAEALEALRREIDAGAHKVSLPVEVRFVKRDAIWLSPMYERDTCMLTSTFVPHPGGAWLERFEAVLADLNGRPHWGKRFTLGPSELSRRFPRLLDFARLRAEVDPEARFVNPLLARALAGT